MRVVTPRPAGPEVEEHLAEESRKYEVGLLHYVSRGGVPAEGGDRRAIYTALVSYNISFGGKV